MVYKDLVKRIDNSTVEALKETPECILNMSKGNIITDAGLGEQYFSTLVFMMIYSLCIGQHSLFPLVDMMEHSKDLNLENYKELTRAYMARGFNAPEFLAYVALDTNVLDFGNEIVEKLDQVTEISDLKAALSSYITYINMLQMWTHLYFPWGLGCAFKKRIVSE